MFNVGPAELIVIALVLLIAVGPEQLPGVIRKVGKAAAQARSMTEGLRSEFMAGLEEIERATDVKAWVEADEGEPADFVKVPPSTDDPDGGPADVEDADPVERAAASGPDPDPVTDGEPEQPGPAPSPANNGASDGDTSEPGHPADEPPATEGERA